MQQDVEMDANINIRFTTINKIPPWDRLTTCCPAIDRVLNGGVPINGITEMFGYSGVGKTQLGMQLALSIQLPVEKGGKGKDAVYICTEDVFPSKRYHQLATSFRNMYNCPQIDFESRTYVHHCTDFGMLKKALTVDLKKLILVKNVGLIVIDSIAGAFRSCDVAGNYQGRGKEINQIANILHQLSDKYKIAVVCMNQVTQNMSDRKIEPCLGLAWSNNVTCRFYISRVDESLTRTFETVCAPDLPNGKCCFVITTEGIKGV